MSTIETEFTMMKAQTAAIEAFSSDLPRSEQIRRIKAVLAMIAKIGNE